MASIRNLKKDINFLASELLTQAYVKQLLKEDANKDGVAKAMVQAVEFKSTLIAKANHPDGKDNKSLVKKHYTAIRKEMYEKFMTLSEEINQL